MCAARGVRVAGGAAGSSDSALCLLVSCSPLAHEIASRVLPVVPLLETASEES